MKRVTILGIVILIAIAISILPAFAQENTAVPSAAAEATPQVPPVASALTAQQILEIPTCSLNKLSQLSQDSNTTTNG